MIYILCRPIQSGKTTTLVDWSAKRTDVFGICTPVVNGKRVFMNAHTKEQFHMEAEGEEETIAVGRFLFSKKNFEKAVQIIRAAILSDGWLVIDEIGPLEIRGEGFCDILNELLATRKEKIILVVREGLANQVIKKFNIKNAEIISETTGLKTV